MSCAIVPACTPLGKKGIAQHPAGTGKGGAWRENHQKPNPPLGQTPQNVGETLHLPALMPLQEPPIILAIVQDAVLGACDVFLCQRP